MIILAWQINTEKASKYAYLRPEYGQKEKQFFTTEEEQLQIEKSMTELVGELKLDNNKLARTKNSMDFTK